MAVDYLPDIDCLGNHFVDVRRNGLVRCHLSIICYYCDRRYSTKQNSISYWNSPYIEYVVAIFMIISSINFSLFLMCLKGK